MQSSALHLVNGDACKFGQLFAIVPA